MSFRELAEITHFHLFTMPVVFMILVHVLYLTSAGNRLKIITTWVSFGGVILDLRLSLAHQLRLAHIRPHHADGRYPYDGGISHHDGDSSLRDVGLEPATVGRKTRERRMT